MRGGGQASDPRVSTIGERAWCEAARPARLIYHTEQDSRVLSFHDLVDATTQIEAARRHPTIHTREHGRVTSAGELAGARMGEWQPGEVNNNW